MSETPTIKRRRRRRVSVRDILQSAPEPLTVPEIAETACCAEITVRRQLKELVDDGEVERPGTQPRLTADGSRRRAGRGRFIYSLH